MNGVVIKDVSRLDTHDRLLHVKKQDFSIGECCQNLIDQRPFGDRAFYIFAHARSDDTCAGRKRMIWQPRLTKPRAETNSMLFKACPGTDTIRVMWMIPAVELWDNFMRGKMMEDPLIVESIYNYKHNKSALEAREPDDLSDDEIHQVYLEVSQRARAPGTTQVYSAVS